MEKISIVFGVPTLFLCVVVVPFLVYFFIQRIKRNRIINKAINDVHYKKYELTSLIKEHESDFYSLETIEKLKSIDSTMEKIEKEISSFSKNAKIIKEEIKKETKKIVDDAESKITGFYFDPFGTQRSMAETEVKFKLKFQSQKEEIEFMFLRVRAFLVRYELFYGSLLPEAKKRADFLGKCKDYLEAEISACKILLNFKEKELLSKRIESSETFLSLVKVEEFSVFTEQFKTLNFS